MSEPDEMKIPSLPHICEDFKITRDTLADLYRMFKLFDKDNTDQIDCINMISVMRGVGQNPTAEQIEEILGAAECKGTETKKIKFEHFLFVTLPHRDAHPDHTLMESFQVFDYDHQGSLSKDKFRTALLEYVDDDFKQNHLENLLNLLPVDKQGRINYVELTTLLSKLAL